MASIEEPKSSEIRMNKAPLLFSHRDVQRPGRALASSSVREVWFSLPCPSSLGAIFLLDLADERDCLITR